MMDIQFAAVMFATSAALVSLGIIVHFLLNVADRKPDASQVRLTVGLFSVVVTSLVILLGLMPGVQSSFGEVGGPVGKITFNLAGPPAVWLIVFIASIRVFDVQPSKDNNDIALTAVLRSHYQGLGFKHYSEWFERLEAFSDVIKPIQLHFIDDLLPKVFYHGPPETTKPRDVRISTLFVYIGNYAIKFQRIRAKAPSDVAAKRPSIYCPHTASTTDGAIKSCHFFSHNGALTQAGYHTHGDWVRASYDDIDVLIVATYDNDVVPKGDYIYVDVSKYVDTQDTGAASVDLAVMADRRIATFSVWEVAASIVSAEKPVPLMFKDVDEVCS